MRRGCSEDEIAMPCCRSRIHQQCIDEWVQTSLDARCPSRHVATILMRFSTMITAITGGSWIVVGMLPDLEEE